MVVVVVGVGGVLEGIPGGVVTSGSPNNTQFQTKKVIFHTYFQTWLFKCIPIFRPNKQQSQTQQTCKAVIISYIRVPAKNILKFFWNLPVILSLSFIWNWNDKYIYMHSHSTLKTIPDSRPKWAGYLFSDLKSLLLHTWITNKFHSRNRFNCADIHCLWLGQTLTKLYIAVFRTDSCKIIYPAY